MAFEAKNKAVIYSKPDHGSGNTDDTTVAGSWNSDTNGATVYTAPSTGAVITSINATTNEAADRDIFVYILDGAEVINLGRVTVPDGAGTDGTEGVYDVLANISGTTTDADGNTVLPLKGAAILKYSLQAALTSGDEIEVGVTSLIADS